MIRAKAARKAYAAIARARRRRRHDDMVDSVGHLTGLFAGLRKANAASLISLKDLARQMRTYPARLIPNAGRGLQLAGATVSYRAPDGTLQALGVICPGFTIEDDADLTSETATQVHERVERQYRLQREELAAKPAPDGMQWAPGHFSFNCAGEVRQGPPMLVQEDPREREFAETAMRCGVSPLSPFPCELCAVEVVTHRRADGTHHRAHGRTITCPRCRAAGAPDYMP